MAQADNEYDVVSLGTGDASGLKAVGNSNIIAVNGDIKNIFTINGKEVTTDEFNIFYNMSDAKRVENYGIPDDEDVKIAQKVWRQYEGNVYRDNDGGATQEGGSTTIFKTITSDGDVTYPEGDSTSAPRLGNEESDANDEIESDANDEIESDANDEIESDANDEIESDANDEIESDANYVEENRTFNENANKETTITKPSDDDNRIPTPLELEEGYTQDTLRTKVQQINGYKAYIQTADPQDKIAQENIKKLKDKYPQLKGIVPKSLTSDSSEEEIKSTTATRNTNKGGGDDDSGVTGRKIVQADPCKPTFLEEMESDLLNFFDSVTALTSPGNAILDLPGNIRSVSDMISKSMNGMVNQMAGALQEKLAGSINQALNNLANKVRSKFKGFPNSFLMRLIKKAQKPAIAPIEKLFSALGCVGVKIGGALGGITIDLITNALKDVVNVARCTAQQVIGALMNKVVNMIDAVTGPLLGPIKKILGKIGNIKSMIFGAIGTGKAIFNVVKGFLSCESEGDKCGSPTSNLYVNGNGAQKSPNKSDGMANFSKIVSGAALKNAAQEKFGSEDGKKSEFEKEYGKWKLFGDKTEKVKVDESEKTKLLSQISSSNLSVFESLFEGQRTRILNSPIGVETEGVNVTEKIKFELRQYELSLKASDEPVYETKVIEEGKRLSEYSSSDDDWNDCNSGNVFKCGLPKVEIFGGGGIGGAAKAIMGSYIPKINSLDIFKDVKTVGSIVGVDFTDYGSGYTSEPIVTFSDNCNQGYGAYGKATIDKNPSSPTYGEITSIIIINPGENYPADDQEVPLYIGGVVIENPGSDYELTDTLDDFDITVEDGEIVDISIVNRRSYNDLPELNINTSTGFGAQIRPLMTKVKPLQTDVLKVIDCVGKV